MFNKIMNKKEAMEWGEARVKSQIENSVGFGKLANGFEFDITTMTAIKQKVTSQKFYEIAPADYMPIVVGEGAFSEEMLTYTDFSVGSDFEAGVVHSGSNDGQMAVMDTQIDGVKVPVIDWAKKIQYNLFELGKAQYNAKSWNLVEAKERSRKKNWDLGIQRTAFLGMKSRADVNGLLTQDDVNINTTLITGFISEMNATEFQAFIGGLIPAFFTNSNSTAFPTHFVMPMSDYLGLGNAVDEGFGVVDRLERMEKAFTKLTGNPNFKIMGLSYCDKAFNADYLAGGAGVNRYALYRYDEETLRMDIPIDYTTTVFDTVDGFNYNSVGYGEFTGCKFYRPLECLYFDHG